MVVLGIYVLPNSHSSSTHLMKPHIYYLVMVHIPIRTFGIFKNIVFIPQFDILLGRAI